MRKNFMSRVAIFSVLLIITYFTGCTPSVNYVEENNYDSLTFSDFVEESFPFITTSLDLRDLGSDFPKKNYAPRTLAVKLGDSCYAAFDTDLLRWAVAWCGDFTSMTTMAQISYTDPFNKDNQIPKVLGTPKISGSVLPGGSEGELLLADPREKEDSTHKYIWGPLPEQKGRWNGVYVKGQEVLLDYRIGSVEIKEYPQAITEKNQTYFVRSIKMGGHEDSVFLNLASLEEIHAVERKDGMLKILQGDNGERTTAVAILGEDEAVQPTLRMEGEGVVVAAFPKNEKERSFSIYLWKGNTADQGAFEDYVEDHGKVITIPDFKKGGENLWKEPVYTKSRLAPDSSAFVLDRIVLPMPNPWQRNVRIADLAFFEKGDRAAAVTFDGDVWLVEGFKSGLEHLKWTRYASGLYEPLSIKISEDQIFVFGKEGITQLVDLNGDGMADYYKNFSNQMAQSMDSREWAGDMVLSPDGDFYVAKGSPLDMGPRFSPSTITGFREGGKYSGSILKISHDGSEIEYYATGLRGPYLGINPQTGMLTTSDQQGNYVPSTPIYEVNRGDYFGIPSAAHLDSLPPIKEPVTWIPHNIDQSGISQVWVMSETMGPLDGQLVHLSFGRPGAFKVLFDSASQERQGGVLYLPQEYPAPLLKGVIGPKDGYLYLTGFNLWGSNSKGITALTRLRYTGKESHMLRSYQTDTQGILLTFDEKVDRLEDVIVKRWNYKRTEQYGSGHFKLDGSPGEEFLGISDLVRLEDGRSFYIKLGDVVPVMQMEISYKKIFEGKEKEEQFFFTVKETGKIADAVRQRIESGERMAMVSGDENKEVAVSPERGKMLFEQKGCQACHSIDGSTTGKYGPSLKGLFGSTVELNEGPALTADENYIRESILFPDRKVVKGYDAEMPSFEGILSDGDIESMIMYIKTLN